MAHSLGDGPMDEIQAVTDATTEGERPRPRAFDQLLVPAVNEREQRRKANRDQGRLLDGVGRPQMMKRIDREHDGHRSHSPVYQPSLATGRIVDLIIGRDAGGEGEPPAVEKETLRVP